jgi:hypothetical protein
MPPMANPPASILSPPPPPSSSRGTTGGGGGGWLGGGPTAHNPPPLVPRRRSQHARAHPQPARHHAHRPRRGRAHVQDGAGVVGGLELCC